MRCNRSRHRRKPTATRTGLTLFELILVLALMVVVAAMAAPSLLNPMRSQRLRSGANDVRSKWTKARVQAMRTGRIQVFRYQSNGDAFQIQPWFAADEMVESNVQTINNVPVAGIPMDALGPRQYKLPGGVTFFGVMVLQDSRALETQEDMATQGLPVAGNAVPILFYPDGTTSSARLALQNDDQKFVVIELRGLTGTTSITDVLTVDELALLTSG